MNRVEKLHREILEKLDSTNRALDRIAALLVSNQLLQECVSPEGEARTAEDCAEIVVESFKAGLCLHENMLDDQQSFRYQLSEFYVDDEEDADSDADADAEDDQDDDSTPATSIPYKF